MIEVLIILTVVILSVGLLSIAFMSGRIYENAVIIRELDDKIDYLSVILRILKERKDT